MTEMTRLSFSSSEMISIKKFVTNGRPYGERISLALALRLLTIASADRLYVLDEIDVLENIRRVSRTKPEEKFRHAPLDLFYHKHFSSLRHILWNIGTPWGLRYRGNQRLTDLIREVASEFGQRPDVWPHVLSYKVAVGGYAEQARQGLTGDWIIYGKYDGKNYYLDLATHWEGEESRAQNLAEKLRLGSEAEFPFCFI